MSDPLPVSPTTDQGEHCVRCGQSASTDGPCTPANLPQRDRHLSLREQNERADDVSK